MFVDQTIAPALCVCDIWGNDSRAANALKL